jgi:hypothetical protein
VRPSRGGESAAARRFRRLEEAFRELRDRSPAERIEPLTRIAIEDPRLHDELVAMLAHDAPVTPADADGPTDPPAARPADAAPSEGRLSAAESLLREIAGGPIGGETTGPGTSPDGETAPDRHVGHYRLIRELGVGSSGVVHLAVDERNGREVALKLLHGLVAGPIAIARFRREAAILTRLDHPGIAAILEADATEGVAGPQCWIAMEPVDGVPVTRWAASAGLGTREILELLAEIAGAVAHAHERGVVHRDLKPANVLVTDDGRPRILDFGAARLDRPEGTGLYTETGQVIGTVPYMAPEQFDGVPEHIGPPCDVYALGVLGYRLLVGRLPLDVAGRPLAEAARIARDDEPSSLGSVDRRLRGPVSAVIGTALEKEPSRRYPDAGAMAADLRRAARAEPVLARPPSLLELARRAARRNRRLLGTAVAAFAVLAAGLVVAVTIAVSADRLRRQETLDRRNAEQRQIEADALRARADAERDEAIRQAAAASLAAAESALRAGEIAEARRLLERVPPAHRGWTWDHLAGRTDRSDGPGIAFDDLNGLAAVVALGPDVMAVGCHGNIGRVHVVRGGEITASWPTLAWINQIIAGPSAGSIIVAGHGGVELMDIADGTRRTITGPGDPARSVRLEDDGRTLLIGGTAGRLSWFDLEAGVRLGHLDFPGGDSIHVGPAGPRTTLPPDEATVDPKARVPASPREVPGDEPAARAAAARLAGRSWIAVVEGTGGRLVRLEEDGHPRCETLWHDDRRLMGRAGFNRAGDMVVTTWAEGFVRVRRGPDWTMSADWPLRRGDHDPVVVLEDDSIVVASSEALTVWTPEGKLRRRLPGHENLPRSMVDLGEGRVLTAALDGTVRRWDLLAPDEPAILTHPRQVRRVAFADAGRTLVTGGGRHPTSDGRIRTWNAENGHLIAEFDHSLTEVQSLMVVADADRGTEQVVASGTGVAAWSLEGGPPRWTAVDRETVWSTADLGDGTMLAVRFHGTLVRLDLRDGTTVSEGQVPIEGPLATRLPDGTVLLVGREPRLPTARWMRIDPVDYSVLAIRDLPSAAAVSVRLLPAPWVAGSRIAGSSSGGAEGEGVVGVVGGDGLDATPRPVAIGQFHAGVRIIDPSTLEIIAEVPGTASGPFGLGVLRGDDGTWRLLAVGDDRLLRFIDPGDQRPTETMLVHEGPVTDVAVSTDGRMIATSSVDRTARIWHRHVSDHRLVPSAGRPAVAVAVAVADVPTIPDRLGAWLTTFVDAVRQRSDS